MYISIYLYISTHIDTSIQAKTHTYTCMYRALSASTLIETGFFRKDCKVLLEQPQH